MEAADLKVERDGSVVRWKPKGERYTVAVDFDGVIHEYVTPWVAPHVIPDGPNAPDVIGDLCRLIQHFDVVILTTRARTWRGRRAIRRWLRWHSGNLWHDGFGLRGLRHVVITNRKVAALVYIDDRAFRYCGGPLPTREEIHRMVPWNKAKR